jgi:hypothetical protein
MTFIGQGSFRRAVAEYTDHYHRERNPEGIGNRVICAPAVPESSGAQVRRRARLVDCWTSTTIQQRKPCQSSIGHYTLAEEALSPVLQAEMTEFPGAAAGERANSRSGHRAGYHSRA